MRPIRELPGKPWRKVLMVWSTKSMCPISSLWSRNCFRKTLSGEGKLIVCITIQQWESIGDITLIFWSYHVIFWCVLSEGWWHAQSFRPRLPLPPSHTCMLPWCLWLTQRYVTELPQDLVYTSVLFNVITRVGFFTPSGKSCLWLQLLSNDLLIWNYYFDA